MAWKTPSNASITPAKTTQPVQPDAAGRPPSTYCSAGAARRPCEVSAMVRSSHVACPRNFKGVRDYKGVREQTRGHRSPRGAVAEHFGPGRGPPDSGAPSAGGGLEGRMHLRGAMSPPHSRGPWIVGERTA